MDTLEVLVPADRNLHDVLVAELSEVGYESFLESESGLSAFISSRHDCPDLRRRTVELIRKVGSFLDPHFRVIESRNWNEEWERSMRPIEVGRFVILPPWSEGLSPGKIPLWIEPKMSFGTGHHESTRLALRFVDRLVKEGSHVLDAGTGTGVLAIAAAYLGAAHVVAFDIDPWSAANCPENIGRNGMSERVQFVHGDIRDVRDNDFDLIVANINRNVLAELIPDFAGRLRQEGEVVLSGLLRNDRDFMIGLVRDAGLSLLVEEVEGEWWAAALHRM